MVLLSMICVISVIHLVWYAFSARGIDVQTALVSVMSAGILYLAILLHQVMSPVLRKKAVAEVWADLCMDSISRVGESIMKGVGNVTGKKNRKA